MNTPPKGSLRFRLSKIGLGCGTFGREIDQAAAFALMDHARAKGITLFDTAEGGGKLLGVSESIVGAWLASRKPKPGSIFIATKIAAPFAADQIESRVMDRLKCLGLDSVDLLYFWDWDESAADPAVLGALERLVKSGKIGALGASNFTVEQMERVLKIQSKSSWAKIKVFQGNNNFAVREISDELRSLCEREDIAIVTYSPLGAGFLTGKHKQRVEPGSRFDIAPGHQGVYFNDLARSRLAELEATAARTGISSIHLAFAWALHQPGITTVLVGGRVPAHLDQALTGQAIDTTKIFSGAS